MRKFKILSIVLLILVSCTEPPKKIKNTTKKAEPKQKVVKKELLLEEPAEYLNEKTAIPFLFEYQQKHKENKVRIKRC